jgi:hypothetical protein
MTGRRLVAAFLAALLGALAVSSAAEGSVATFRVERGEPLNDLVATPGATFRVGVTTICRRGYATSVRDVPEEEKIAVYTEYGVSRHETGQYEIDHLIPLELGGDNAETNLWPELNDHPPGYLNSKDLLENRIHGLVCEGVLVLQTAQHAIATDWVDAYHRYLGGWPGGTGLPTTSSNVGVVGSTPPSSGGVTITSLTSPISPGEEASLSAHSSTPGDRCTLSVTLPSGVQSRSRGLGSTATDSRGDASWSWRIGTDTDPGRALTSVRCDAGTANRSFVIT